MKRALCCAGRGGAARGLVDSGVFLRKVIAAGVGAECPVVGVPGFGFRVCRSVWLVVRGAA